jgi:hypothetical protein
MPTKASRIRRKSVGDTQIREGRVIWSPSTYARTYLSITDEIDCGPVDDGTTEERVTAAFRTALRARKEWRQRRREESLTLTPVQLRERRNQEIAERIIAGRAWQDAQQDKEAA